MAKTATSISDTSRARVLVADDDPVTLELLRHYLDGAGLEVFTAADGAAARDRLASDDIDVAVLDLIMPGASGLDLVRGLQESGSDTQVIVISGEGNIEDAVEAMRLGAFHYFTKPLFPDDIILHVKQALRMARLESESRPLREPTGLQMTGESFVALSDSSREMLARAHKISRLDSTLLLTGESGTGKTLLARTIHNASVRAGKPFVAVSCASLPRELIEAELFGYEKGAFTGALSARAGLAETADGGTLFLDEIGDLPLELQPKLLTFLEDRQVQRIGARRTKHVDVRLVAATHKDLEEMCERGEFRQDLYFRLNVLRLHLPPLADRREDLRELVQRIVSRTGQKHGRGAYSLSPEVMERLEAHSWPGNIRELENVLERACAWTDDGTVLLEHLEFGRLSPRADESVPDLVGRTLEEIEKTAILQAIEAMDGNRAAAARMLGVSDKTIYNKLKRYEEPDP